MRSWLLWLLGGVPREHLSAQNGKSDGLAPLHKDDLDTVPLPSHGVHARSSNSSTFQSDELVHSAITDDPLAAQLLSDSERLLADIHTTIAQELRSLDESRSRRSFTPSLAHTQKSSPHKSHGPSVQVRDLRAGFIPAPSVPLRTAGGMTWDEKKCEWLPSSQMHSAIDTWQVLKDQSSARKRRASAKRSRMRTITPLHLLTTSPGASPSIKRRFEQNGMRLTESGWEKIGNVDEDDDPLKDRSPSSSRSPNTRTEFELSAEQIKQWSQSEAAHAELGGWLAEETGADTRKFLDDARSLAVAKLVADAREIPLPVSLVTPRATPRGAFAFSPRLSLSGGGNANKPVSNLVSTGSLSSLTDLRAGSSALDAFVVPRSSPKPLVTTVSSSKISPPHNRNIAHGRSGSIDRLRKWTDVDSDDSFGDIDPGNVDLGLKLKSSHNSSKSHRRGLSISSDDSPSKNALKGRVTNAQLQQYADDEDETDDLEEVILEAKKMHGGEEEGEHKDEGDDDGLSLESLSLRLQRLQGGEEPAFPLSLSDSSSQSPSDDAHSHSSTGDDEAEDWGDEFEGDIDLSALKRLSNGALAMTPLST